MFKISFHCFHIIYSTLKSNIVTRHLILDLRYCIWSELATVAWNGANKLRHSTKNKQHKEQMTNTTPIVICWNNEEQKKYRLFDLFVLQQLQNCNRAVLWLLLKYWRNIIIVLRTIMKNEIVLSLFFFNYFSI